MRPMVIDRRQFAAGTLSLLAQCATGSASRASDRGIIAATTRNADGSHAAVIYDLDKGLLNAARLPQRGHDIAVNPVSKECVAFARRPGDFAVAFGVSGKRPPIIFLAPTGRHFYGHGVFSKNGRLLYTTENEFENGLGIIGVWDASAQYRRVGELPAYGIGPHDINLLDDGRTLVIANGGLRTHPDHGRQPLNLATMSASLVYVDGETGDLIEKHGPAKGMEKVSIRHLDVGRNDTVVFGGQFMGPRSQIVELVGFHRRGESIQYLPPTPALHRALRHYVSSIATDRSGESCAVTSSRGQHAVVIDIARQRVSAMHAFADVSGIAPAPLNGQFVATSGTGHLALTDAARLAHRSEKAAWSWDNHAVRYDI